MSTSETLRIQIISECHTLTDDEDLALRTEDIDFHEGVGWGLAVRLAELRNISVEAAFAVLSA